MKATALLAAFALAACNEGEAQPAKVAEQACRSEVFEEASLTHCIADPAQHRIVMALDAPDGDPARSLAVLKDMLPEPARVAFAMNGGMFDDAGKPIGYYVEDGERRHKLNRADGAGNFHLKPNGVFFGTGAEWQVLSTEAFAATVKKRPEFGTQSGPMLVIDGKLHPAFQPDGTSTKIRNAVGVDRQGRAHFVISEAPISFGKLARYYRDVLKTPNALFLDGSVSQLWDPQHHRIDGGPPLGPLIVVEKGVKPAPEKAGP
jgi:uncharacterized protein YigE (DUF2233 family)